MMNRNDFEEAASAAVLFIESLTPIELGIYTLRKSFEVGYILGLGTERARRGEKDNTPVAQG
jgi:hypothetical protein